MGVRILHDPTLPAAALYDSVTGTAFGPLFTDHAEATGFLAWLKEAHGRDPRELSASELEDAASHFRHDQASTPPIGDLP